MKNHLSSYGLRRGRLFALALLLGTPAGLLAQPAYLVKDIATTGVNALPWFAVSSPMVELADAAYFFADDGIHGRELWRSDGTGVGTWMVRDVCPGECASNLNDELVVYGDRLYFGADDGVHGRELWRSDGTDAGTEMVADIWPGHEGSSPRWLTTDGGAYLLFTASDPAHGLELWRSDGTGADTSLVLDINPTGSSSPRALTPWNGAVWFAADDGVHGSELWTSDGDPVNTHLVKDIWPGAESGDYPADQVPQTHFETPAPAGPWLLFPADDGVHGIELWRTDGTEPNTTLVADIQTGPPTSGPSYLTSFSGEVFFRASETGYDGELWKSDGTTGGTVLVRDIEPGSDGSSPSGFTIAGGKLFFLAYTSGAGGEIWTTDGSEAGTTMVADIRPGPDSGVRAFSGLGIEAFGDRLLFQADDGTHGLEPWVSDGTEAGTHLARDINTGTGSAFDFWDGNVLESVAVGDQALFFAFDDDHGWELWKTDAEGTEAGTTLVRDIDQQHSSIPRPVLIELTEMSDAAGTLYLMATDLDHGEELWASDGTAGTTRLVKDIEPTPRYGSVPRELTPLAGRLLFVAWDGSEERLWTSDGSGPETVAIVSSSTTGPLDPHTLARFGDAVYFSAHDASDHYGLWRSDGTDAGTHPFPEPSPLPSASELAALGDQLFLAIADELWATRGDQATTEKLADVGAAEMVPSSSLLFFAGFDAASGWELWVSDGTPGNTHQVLDLLPGAESSLDLTGAPVVTVPRPDKPPIAALATRNLAFFAADDGVHGRELWASDGTADGTHLVLDVRPGAAGSEPRYLTVVGDRVFFTADDGVHGEELWVSDGTAAGTFMVLDIADGAASSVPASLSRVWGELVFSAWRPDTGRELWRTDGTPAGTALIEDINPGSGSSSPEHFTLSGSRLFFTANDGTTGFEPWALPIEAPVLAATKELSGAPIEGGVVTYTLRLTNPGTFASADNPGDELVDTLPTGLELLGASADTGKVETDPPSRTVRWNGSVPAGGTVTITVEARIEPGTAGETLANQATVAFDRDGDGTSEGTAVSDDPATGAAGDPTALAVLSVVEVPALSPTSLALLALLLATAGGLVLRR